MLITRGTALGRDFAFAPKNIFALNFPGTGVERAGNDATPQKAILIRQDKAAHAGNAIMVIDDQWRARLERDFADFIDSNLVAAGCRRIERRRIDNIPEGCDLTFDILRYQLQPVG